LSAGDAMAQNGTMRNGGGWMSGYGGILMPILLVIVVAGVVMWFVKQKGK